MKHRFVMISAVLASLLLFLIEQVWNWDYIYKTGVKWVLFIGLPVLFILKIKRSTLKESLNLKHLRLKDLSIGFLLGSICFVIVWLAFLITKSFINLDGIIADLIDQGINAKNFIFIGLYISFFNALLEEFFFRGYVFLNLYPERPKLAYWFSSVLFGLYHVGIFFTWFNPYVMALALFGLILVGFVFNYLDTISKNFLNSYLVHVLADLAIISIGLIYIF